MIYLLVSISCSVIVGVLLKLARRYKIDIPQAVTWNYLFAIGLSLFFFKPGFPNIDSHLPYPVYLALGILLPTVFWILALSVRYIGIAKTDIAQRLSLCIPLLAAYFLFNEQFSFLKLAGLVLGFLSIGLILHRRTTQKNRGLSFLYPVLVFFGFGIIDVLFKKIAEFAVIPYTTSIMLIFSLSFLISLLFIFLQSLIKHRKMQFINFICGCILGFFNFFNILFYLKAHRAMADDPSAVFAVMNLGVIILGSSVGIFVFKENLSKINFYGLSTALIAIFVIAIAQKYAF